MSDLLGGLGALTLATDKRAYTIGETPTYIIQGGLPDAEIAWTSFRNNTATGEYQAAYGQTLDAEGKAAIRAAQPWSEEAAGFWQKQVIVLDPNQPWNPQTAQVFFTVSKADQSAPAPDAPAGEEPGFLDQTVDVGGTSIPIIAVLTLGGVALFAFARR